MDHDGDWPGWPDHEPEPTDDLSGAGGDADGFGGDFGADFDGTDGHADAPDEYADAGTAPADVPGDGDDLAPEQVPPDEYAAPEPHDADPADSAGDEPVAPHDDGGLHPDHEGTDEPAGQYDADHDAADSAGDHTAGDDGPDDHGFDDHGFDDHGVDAEHPDEQPEPEQHPETDAPDDVDSDSFGADLDSSGDQYATWHDDEFPPELDLGADAPEPHDGYPWSDPATLGSPDPAGFTDSAPVDTEPVEPQDLLSYAGLDDTADNPWAALLGSDDPATSSLARWWGPTG